VANSYHLHDRIKVWFVQAHTEDEAFAEFLCDHCAGLKMTLSKNHRLIAELETLGGWGDVRCLDYMREIVALESRNLRILEQLLAGTQVGIGLKDGYVVDREEKE
nr:hypothetical protein [Tanacetum cinerariifolium]